MHALHTPCHTFAHSLARTIHAAPITLSAPAGHACACQTSYLRVAPSTIGSRRTGRMAGVIYGEAPARPNPGCIVCGKAQLQLTANTAAMTLQQLVDKVCGDDSQLVWAAASRLLLLFCLAVP